MSLSHKRPVSVKVHIRKIIAIRGALSMPGQKGAEAQEATSFSASSTAIIEELRRTLLAISEVQIHIAVQSLLSARPRLFYRGRP